MAQHRPPPAFQEYAASMLSNMTFRMMSLSSRGLLYTLRLEYWVGNPLPAASDRLARVLGIRESEVTSALLELGDLVYMDQGFIKIPELDDYKQHLEDRQKKQSDGGKEGARRAKVQKNSPKDANIEGGHKVTQGVPSGSSVQINSVQSRSIQERPVINEVDSEWLEEYDKTPGHDQRVAGT